MSPVDIRQVFADSPRVLTEILADDVNLAIWRRRLPAQVEDFAGLVLGLGSLLADERVVEVDEHQAPVLPGLLREASDLHGYEGSLPMWCGWSKPSPACWARDA